MTPGTAAQCSARKVKQLYHYTCPMIGCPTDIYYGPLVSHTPFNPSRGVAGYKTGSLGLGHIAFWVKDLKATLDFYQEVMGFSISDYIAWDDNDAVFLHCNARHHTLALMAEAEAMILALARRQWTGVEDAAAPATPTTPQATGAAPAAEARIC